MPKHYVYIYVHVCLLGVGGGVGITMAPWAFPNPPGTHHWVQPVRKLGTMEPGVSVWNVKTGVLSHLGALKNSTPSEPPTYHIGVFEGDVSIFKAVQVILVALKLQ